ncbi:hypothetical protein ACFL2V_07945 [Pseudomonadota bacterium]
MKLINHVTSPESPDVTVTVSDATTSIGVGNGEVIRRSVLLFLLLLITFCAHSGVSQKDSTEIVYTLLDISFEKYVENGHHNELAAYKDWGMTKPTTPKWTVVVITI